MKVIFMVYRGNIDLFKEMEWNGMFSYVLKDAGWNDRGSDILAIFKEKDNKSEIPTFLIKASYLMKMDSFIDLSEESKDKTKIICDKKQNVLVPKSFFFPRTDFKIIDPLITKSFFIVDHYKKYAIIKKFSVHNHKIFHSNYVQVKEKTIWEGDIKKIPAQYKKIDELIKNRGNNGKK